MPKRYNVQQNEQIEYNLISKRPWPHVGHDFPTQAIPLKNKGKLYSTMLNKKIL